MDARLLDILTQQQAARFAGLAGSDVRATLRVAPDLLNQAIAAGLPADGPFRTIVVRPQAGDRLIVRLTLARPSFLPPIAVTLAIDRQPRLPDDPVLGFQAVGGMGGLMRLAAPLIGGAVTLPPGVRLDGDRLLVDLRAMLQQHGQAALLDLAQELRVTATDDALVMSFIARVPASTP
ncbi:MAG TPA: hypothetical protein VFX12_04575 [Vicinamibacterales bacterium]|nr:hypothetical protein [Vicinamibacterales bacterium]